jgi:hypothetical protein
MLIKRERSDLETSSELEVHLSPFVFVAIRTKNDFLLSYRNGGNAGTVKRFRVKTNYGIVMGEEGLSGIDEMFWDGGEADLEFSR